ncbi:MAG: hypothetical protein L0Z51_10010, partial [Candidatus Latescibacteria bacterium]|nr:hypothetical protein [Candidatus Latescibacterota bacterium]
MDTLMRCGVCAVLVWVNGCANSPPSPPVANEVEDTPWGDEYAGIDEDADLEAVLAGASRSPGRTSSSVHALFDPAYEGTDAPLRSLTAMTRVPHAAARYRHGASGDAGAIELFDLGPLAHVVAGAIRPRVGEGAWLADARELGTPVAPGAASA